MTTWMKKAFSLRVLLSYCLIFFANFRLALLTKKRVISKKIKSTRN